MFSSGLGSQAGSQLVLILPVLRMGAFEPAAEPGQCSVHHGQAGGTQLIWLPMGYVLWLSSSPTFQESL